MSGVNKAILVGRLGADPTMRRTQQSDTAVSNFNIATTEKYNDRNGKRQERTEWHRIVVWDKLAEICHQYLKKGKQVYIEGRLQTREWDDAGSKRYTTEVVAREMVMLGDAPMKLGVKDEEPPPGGGYEDAPNKGDDDDDLPF